MRPIHIQFHQGVSFQVPLWSNEGAVRPRELFSLMAHRDEREIGRVAMLDAVRSHAGDVLTANRAGDAGGQAAPNGELVFHHLERTYRQTGLRELFTALVLDIADTMGLRRVAYLARPVLAETDCLFRLGFRVDDGCRQRQNGRGDSDYFMVMTLDVEHNYERIEKERDISVSRLRLHCYEPYLVSACGIESREMERGLA